ncbi:MAG: hypothetical protein IT368_15370 [Candidatus Hydrogenedentes bacterium]|nr:hypothetical protein [Candidatus Hydrogenedentota bacterium]
MFMWADLPPEQPDVHVAFRGVVEVAKQTEVEFHTLAANWFVLWLNGVYLLEGPARYDVGFPEYEVNTVTLPPGRNVIAAQVHHYGVGTRILADIPGFFYCKVFAGGKELAVDWKATKLDGYVPQVRRINPQLGWIEWCDTRGNPAQWQQPDFVDSAWPAAVEVKPAIGELRPLRLGPVQQVVHELEPVAHGSLAENYGYDRDDPPYRFFVRTLDPQEIPPQGVWRRYDLGQVRLGRPKLTLDLPAGAVVEIAASEYLLHDRVTPYITLSLGTSCNLDHYVARGGVQEFFPLTPKGGRFVEVHVIAPPEQVKFLDETYVERTYFPETEGSFACSDPLLNRIWQTGVDTFRACTEDAVIDNPTRERGQWTGDVVSVGMDIAGAAHSDLRLLRRGLEQTAQSTREDGLIAAMAPGVPIYLGAYSAQWNTACWHYYTLTGDRSLLEELWPAAVKNMAAFENFWTPEGLDEAVAPSFIDWGYKRPPGSVDMPLNMHYLDAVRATAQWAALLGEADAAEKWQERDAVLTAIIEEWLSTLVSESGWETAGYHAAVLGLRLNLVPEDEVPAAIAFIKAHMLNCFPNNPDAPRLSDPSVSNPQIITPYFGHYAMPVLIEHGEMPFVLDQYRTCWGWALKQSPTWIEVFDTRWSHCHQWAGCPTWQLSRYLSGLRPRFDKGPRQFEWCLRPAGLEGATVTVPVAGGSPVSISWRCTDGVIDYRCETEAPITLAFPAGVLSDVARTLEISGGWSFRMESHAGADRNCG